MKSDFEFEKVTLEGGKEVLEDRPLHDTTIVIRRPLKPAVAKAKAKKPTTVDIIAPVAVNKAAVDKAAKDKLGIN